MNKLTETGKVIVSTSPEEIKLDKQIKRVLACKPILARILAEVVEECKGMSYDDVESCIEGEILIDEIPVEPGLSNIVGSSQEDYQNLEGMIRYDLRTYLMLPNQKEPQLAKILIDVEAQKDENPGYDIPVRGLYYGCRMISSQLTTEFSVDTNDPVKYGNVKKVYSIFICTETSQKRANCIEKYSIKKEMLCGENNDSPRYDLLSAIIVNLSRKHDCGNTDNKLIHFLTDLFNEEIPGDKKVDLLEKEYHLRLTEEIEKEVLTMCTYTTSVKEKGFEEGIEKGIEKGFERGIEKGRAGIIETLLKEGRTPAEINELIKVPLGEIEKVEASLLTAAQ